MIKKLLINKSIFFAILVFLLTFSGNVKAQCSITTSTSTSTLTCGTSPLSSCGGNLYIGDGTTVMTLSINSGFNLSCLGPINLVIRNNATILFGNGANDRLTLAEGSTILINSGGNISGGNQCTASDRIYIGTNLVSTCNGQAGTDASFSDLESLGGTGTVTSNSPVCVGNMINVSAIPPPNGSFTYSWSGPNSFTSTLQNPTLTAISTSGGQYNVVMTRVSDGKAAYGHITVAVGSAINATLTSSDADNAFCSGTSVTFTAGGGTNYDFKVDSVSMQNGTNSTYTTTTLTNGQIVTVAVSNASCSIISSGITNTVNAQPSTPTVGAITQPTCAAPTGSVVLSGLPATGTWTLTRSGTSSATTTGTGTSVSISGLASGTYYYAVTNGSCTSGTSTGVTINVTTKTWNGSWSPSAPTSEDAIVFEGTGTYSSTSDLSACSCLVKNSVSVVINSGHTLTLTNELTVIDFGSIAFLDTASLLQINDVANSGDIDYQRITNARETDYTYWSSPVSPQTLGELYPLGSTFYSYEATASGEDWKDETGGTTMEAGKGYIANRGAEVPSGVPPPPGLFNVTFVGVPNNGTKTIAIGPTGTSNLIGNPYPSAINADLFLATNSTRVEGTIYFWTHNTAIQLASNITNGTAGSGAYAYTSDDYASYNGTGGVATSGGITPTGKIAAAQSFFTTSIASGTVTFNNSMRVSGSNAQFFKTKNSKGKTANIIEKNRVWLNLTNTKGAFKQTLIGYITDATNDYDNRFDGESFDGNEFVDFYSVNQDKNLVIQGRALPFNENDEVSLGFRTTINGAFTINIDQVDGLLTNQAVFLEDKLTNTVFDLKSGNYTFNTTPGTFNDRFVLKYSNKTLGTKTFDSSEKTVLVSNKNKQIKINSFAETIDKVSVYDLSGRQIYQKAKVNSNELTISDLLSSHQTLVIKTVMQNGETVTDKIIY